MCRSIFNTSLYKEINELSGQEVLECMSRVSETYWKMMDDFTRTQKGVNAEQFMRQYAISYENHSDTFTKLRTRVRIIVTKEGSLSRISYYVNPLTYKEHVGHALCPIMTGIKADDKSDIMNKYGSIYLQVETFSKDKIDTMIDFIDSKVRGLLKDEESKTMFLKFLRSVEAFFYIFGYYPRISRDLGLMCSYLAVENELKSTLGSGVGHEQVLSSWLDKLQVATSGGYWRNLFKSTYTPNSSSEPEAIIMDSYDLIRGTRSPVFTVIEDNLYPDVKVVEVEVKEDKTSENDEVIEQKENEEKDEKMNMDDMKKHLDEMAENINKTCKEEYEKLQDEIKSEEQKQERPVWEKVAIGAGCIIAGIGVALLGRYVYDNFFDTVEVTEDPGFFDV